MASVLIPSIRDVPQSGVPQWEADILNQLKEAVEILAGVRQSGVRAVVNKNITVAVTDDVTMRRVTAVAPGAYSQTEFLNLMNNVQALAENLIAVQNRLNTLIQQLEA